MKRNTVEHFSWEAFVKASNRNNPGRPNNGLPSSGSNNNPNNNIANQNVSANNHFHDVQSAQGLYNVDNGGIVRPFAIHPTQNRPAYSHRPSGRHPWESRVPPYPFHPPRTPFYSHHELSPYGLPPPLIPIGHRPESGYQSQRVPYSVTRASRPPPADSVVAFRQAPASSRRGANPPRRARGRRQTAEQRRNQEALLPANQHLAIDSVEAGFHPPNFAPNSINVPESIDLTDGPDEPEPGNQLVPSQEWNWQFPDNQDYAAGPILPYTPPLDGLYPPAPPFIYEPGFFTYETPLYPPYVHRAVGAPEMIRFPGSGMLTTTTFLSSVHLPEGTLYTFLRTTHYIYTEVVPYFLWYMSQPAPWESVETQAPRPQRLDQIHSTGNVPTSSEQIEIGTYEAESTTPDFPNPEQGRSQGFPTTLQSSASFEQPAPTDLSSTRRSSLGDFSEESDGSGGRPGQSGDVPGEAIPRGPSIARPSGVQSYAGRVRYGRSDDSRQSSPTEHAGRAVQRSAQPESRSATSSTDTPRLPAPPARRVHVDGTYYVIGINTSRRRKTASRSQSGSSKDE